jgi:hypothetical protein
MSFFTSFQRRSFQVPQYSNFKFERESLFNDKNINNAIKIIAKQVNLLELQKLKKQENIQKMKLIKENREKEKEKEKETEKSKQPVKVSYKKGWFTGTLVNNKREGFGKYEFPNGNVYEGEWKNNSIHGRGIMNYKSGNISFYNGEWKNNKWNGIGTKICKNGIIYRGIWKDGKLNLNEEITFTNPKDGTIFKGYMKDGKKHGNGVIIYKTGYVYEGIWKNNHKSDYGILKKGTEKHLQYWRNNALVESLEISTNLKFKKENFDNITIINEDDFTSEELDLISCPIGIYRICPVVTPCGHKFCKTELEKYNNKNNNMSCPLCRTRIDYYHEDKETKEIIKKCQFKVKDIQIDSELFVKCYQFFNKWYHCQKMNVPYTYFCDGDTTSDDDVDDSDESDESEYENGEIFEDLEYYED